MQGRGATPAARRRYRRPHRQVRPIFILIRAARISCYTGLVQKTRQNVTLVVEEDLLLAARKVALDRRTSVNQLVRECLAALVEEPGRRRLARTRLTTASKTGLVGVGKRKWTRDELYDRRERPFLSPPLR